MSEAIARRIVVHGNVQGVGFRDSCGREASVHGVAGWVRNQPDGAVEALFEGPRTQVEQMVDWARNGPRFADVQQIDVATVEPTGLPTFEVSG